MQHLLVVLTQGRNLFFTGRVFALEYKASLSDSNWIALPLVAGTGKMLTLTDPTTPLHLAGAAFGVIFLLAMRPAWRRGPARTYPDTYAVSLRSGGFTG